MEWVVKAGKLGNPRQDFKPMNCGPEVHKHVSKSL